MKIFLPCRGEFGWVVMAHAPQVYAHKGQKIVCCEPGMEAMYPGAERYFHTIRIEDENRAGLSKDRGFWNHYKEIVRYKMGWQKNPSSWPAGTKFIEPDENAPREYFVPQPVERFGLNCDIVVCPRFRRYGPDKNWTHWQTLIDALQAEGLSVFAAGAPDSSYDVKTNAGRAWDHERFLDASIEAMLGARWVIATDTGLAHLAVMCGRPLLMITHADGRVADGKTDTGMQYWYVYIHRYITENHRHVPIRQIYNAWHDADTVLAAVRQALTDRPATRSELPEAVIA